MNLILRRVLVPAASAISGGLIVLGAIKLNPSLLHLTQTTHEKPQSDPFEQMRKMQEQMENQFFGFGGTMASYGMHDVAEREDEGNIYFDIRIDDVNAASINTKVENGYLTITGETESKSGADAKDRDGFFAERSFKSTFNRTFPLPENVDQDKMQVTSEKDKIVLKFPKMKS